jgi:hypothetical protein
MLLRNILLNAIMILAPCASAVAMPIGSWSVHLPYFQCKTVTGSATHIWSATDNSLFRVTKADMSMEVITKIEGLSDLSIGALEYNSANDVLVVGYQNGNIDLIKGNKIINLPDIKRSQIVADKSINDIYFIGNYAYLATGFGVVVVDTDRNEIKDTYLIGANGAYIRTYQIVSDGFVIYVSTASGISFANLSDPFLSNYAAWSQMPGIPIGIYNTITLFNNKLVANLSRYYMGQGFFNDTTLYYDFDLAAWSYIPGFGDGHTVKKLACTSERLWVVDWGGIIPFDTNLVSSGPWYTLGPGVLLFPNDVFPVANKDIWYADDQKGLVNMTEPWFGFQYRPNGPVSIDAAAMDFSDGKLIVVPGGKDDAWNNIYNTSGISFYEGNQWTVLQKNTLPALDTLYDINFCEIDPEDKTHVWLGSWGRGLIEVKDNNIVNRYTQYNSILQSKVEYPWCGIGGIEYDQDGNLWMVNSHTMKCLKVKKADNTWAEFDFQGMIVTGTTVGDLMITQSGQKWMIIPRNGGIIVFDDAGTINTTSDDKKKKLGFTSTNGSMPGTDVLCMAEDHDGEIWIGTDKGIGVFYCAENIFSTDGCNAQQILIQQGQYTQILMESQTVTSIAVDGANRKWIATESGGVFLMSADGTKEIQHFTAENSPLLSDNVTGVTIDPSTGEVFFSTGKGIVSYRGEAIEGADEMGDVYAYPNPVQPGYSGPIAIQGLVRDADVKITDISGNLVYQTTALGGQAIWNGNNFQGQRAASGVYLVFITNEDGTETRVTKILFMH